MHINWQEAYFRPEMVFLGKAGNIEKRVNMLGGNGIRITIFGCLPTKPYRHTRYF